jgi:hypothetical protein
MSEFNINDFFDTLSEYEQFNQAMATDYVTNTLCMLIAEDNLLVIEKLLDYIQRDRHTTETLTTIASLVKEVIRKYYNLCFSYESLEHTINSREVRKRIDKIKMEKSL